MSRLLAARRRGAFQAKATTTLRAIDNDPVHYDSDSSRSERIDRDDDEEDQDQERELSRRYGEATEAGGTSGSGSSSAGRKRDGKTTEQEIEAEYASAQRAKKKPRPTVTIPQLTGPDGLIRIRHEFPTSLRYPRCHNKNVRQDVDAAATYSRNLVASYQTFCYDLCPSLAFEDVVLKLDKLGSKKEMKSFLQNMRDDVRNAHVEKLYGKDKAAKMIQELEMGLKQQQSEILKEHFAQMESDAVMPGVVHNDNEGDDHNSNNNNSLDLSNETSNANESNHVATPPPVALSPNWAHLNTYKKKRPSSIEHGRIGKENTPELGRSPNPTNKLCDHDDDDDEEVEASFDDIQGTSPRVTSPNAFDAPMDQTKPADQNAPGVSNSNASTEADGTFVTSTPKQAQQLSSPPNEYPSDEELEASFDDVIGTSNTSRNNHVAADSHNTSVTSSSHLYQSQKDGIDCSLVISEEAEGQNKTDGVILDGETSPSNIGHSNVEDSTIEFEGTNRTIQEPVETLGNEVGRCEPIVTCIPSVELPVEATFAIQESKPSSTCVDHPSDEEDEANDPEKSTNHGDNTQSPTIHDKEINDSVQDIVSASNQQSDTKFNPNTHEHSHQYASSGGNDISSTCGLPLDIAERKEDSVAEPRIVEKTANTPNLPNGSDDECGGDVGSVQVVDEGNVTASQSSPSKTGNFADVVATKSIPQLEGDATEYQGDAAIECGDLPKVKDKAPAHDELIPSQDNSNLLMFPHSTQPSSQQHESIMITFAQPSQEPSQLDDSSQFNPEIPTQFDQPMDAAALAGNFTPSQSQDAPFIMGAHTSQMSQDETATVVPTQGELASTQGMSLCTASQQSQSYLSNNDNQELMTTAPAVSNDHEVATMIATMSTPTDMDES